MKTIVVSRIFSNENKTLSECDLWLNQFKGGKIFSFKGIELPWRDNKRLISCIYPGVYRFEAVRRSSNGRYAIWVKDVPGRSEIMLHAGNYVWQLLGCLSPGFEFKDIDNDGIIDVTSSRYTMDLIQSYVPLGERGLIHFINTYNRIGNLDPKTEKRV